MEHPSSPAASPRRDPLSASSGGDHSDAARGLQALRLELDVVDARVLEALRERLEMCGRIALHKRRHAIPVLQPARIEFVHTRAAAFAAVHGLRPAFVRSLYELVIEESCRLEDEVIRSARAA